MTNSNHPGPNEIAAHAAMTADIIRDAEIVDIRDALQCAYALICTPIARRKLGLAADDERVAMIRAALLTLSQKG